MNELQAANELLDIAISLEAQADAFKAEITLGTREQWMAWQHLTDAARYLRNAAWYLGAEP